MLRSSHLYSLRYIGSTSNKHLVHAISRFTTLVSHVITSGVSRISVRGVLKVRPDTRTRGGGGGGVLSDLILARYEKRGGGGVLSASGLIRKVGGGGGGGGYDSVS